MLESPEIAHLEVLAVVSLEPIIEGQEYQVRVYGWGPLKDLDARFSTGSEALSFALELGGRHGFHLLVGLKKK